MPPAQNRTACAGGDGEGTSVFEDTLGAAAALREELAEERTLASQYRAIAWGRILTPVQVGLCSMSQHGSVPSFKNSSAWALDPDVLGRKA